MAFLIAAWAVPRPALADGSRAAAAPKFSVANPTTPFGWSNTVADFNADGLPDVAVADRLGRRGSSRYRIDVHLSGDRRQLITFLSTTDVRIRAIDIDHDDDLDLVAMPLMGQHVIDVWLNDGRGHFVESRSASVPQGDLNQQSGTFSGGAMVQFAALPPPRRFNAAAIVAARLALPRAPAVVVSSTRDQAPPRAGPSAPSSPRAPPVLIPIL